MNQTITHICAREEWLAARQSGFYTAPSLDSAGFIHCSRPDQVMQVANVFYTSQHELVLLVIDPTLLSSKLKWEPPVHPAPGQVPETKDLFPHIYGPFNIDAVTAVFDFEPDADGLFHLPPALIGDS